MGSDCLYQFLFIAYFFLLYSKVVYIIILTNVMSEKKKQVLLNFFPCVYINHSINYVSLRINCSKSDLYQSPYLWFPRI